MKHLVPVSPRFHRKRYEGSESTAGVEGGANSPQLPKRSWFSNFLSEREKVEVIAVFRDKSFTELKASLLRAFDVCAWILLYLGMYGCGCCTVQETFTLIIILI